MDEEDGRPGARAVQTGHPDAPRGVSALSLHNGFVMLSPPQRTKDLFFPKPGHHYIPVPHPCDVFVSRRWETTELGCWEPRPAPTAPIQIRGET